MEAMMALNTELDEIIADVENLEARLKKIRESLTPLLKILNEDEPAAVDAKSARRVGRPSKLESLRKKQGQFMSALRHLSQAKRKRLMKVRATEGYDAALKLSATM